VTARFEQALELGDDALVLAQRLAEWCTHAPEIEEDIALANIALDLLGQARSLLGYAGELEGDGRTGDDLAYSRDEHDFRNVLLVEQQNGDFANTIVRQLFFSAYQLELYSDVEHGDDETLAGVAGKAVKEVAYHLDHVREWTLRLGDGTNFSHERAQAAVERLWPYTHELFEGRAGSLHERWLGRVEPILAEATLIRPVDGWAPSGGRAGRHTEALGYLLAELQYLHRSHPGVAW
jgi:ring-1,2-phenylacetyl-CoA epoxidase subunit PaaC